MDTSDHMISSAHGGLGCDVQARKHELIPGGVQEHALASGLVNKGTIFA